MDNTKDYCEYGLSAIKVGSPTKSGRIHNVEIVVGEHCEKGVREDANTFSFSLFREEQCPPRYLFIFNSAYVSVETEDKDSGDNDDPNHLVVEAIPHEWSKTLRDVVGSEVVYNTRDNFIYFLHGLVGVGDGYKYVYYGTNHNRVFSDEEKHFGIHLILKARQLNTEKFPVNLTIYTN